jgi:glucose/arabinose dehydrogenase
MRKFLLSVTACCVLSACASEPRPIAQGQGPSPTLPAPHSTPIPTLKTAKAVGWAEGAHPTAPAGFTVTRYAQGFAHPRWLLVLDNGDVLVAESSTKPSKPKNIRGWVQQKVQKHAGALNESADRISLVRDSDHDGIAETKTVLVTGLNQPFGMAVAGDTLYVANTDAIVAYPFKPGETQITASPRVFGKLPFYPPDNHHWTRNLLLSADGKQLFVTAGSASNIAEHGMQAEEGRAAIQVFDIASGANRIFATGLRNPNGMAWNPQSGALWTVVNERDEIGDDLVPDYLTSVKDGAFYGWPYSYYGQTVDTRVKPQDAALVARALKPDYALGSHTASLGLTFYTAQNFPARYQNGAFIGQHGSWNRSEYSGYKVVFVPFVNGAPSGAVEDFLTGFIDPARNLAFGRPVGVAIDRDGALLVADDVGNAIWRVSAATAPAIAQR